MKDSQILDNFEFDAPEFPWDEGESGEVVGKYYAVTEANLAAARLRSEGIPCFVAGAISQATLPHVPGYVRLHVRPSDAELAREILGLAAIDAGEESREKSGSGAIVFLAVAIGLILAWLLIKAMSYER